MAFKVDVIKKEMNEKKDKNQVIWEEFVSKNNIKKNYFSGGTVSFNVLNRRASSTLKEFISHSKADIKTQVLERKNYFGKPILTSITPKTGNDIE